MSDREDLAKNIKELASKLQGMSLQMLTQEDMDHVVGVTCSFIRYQATQGFRIANWLKESHLEDVDLIAHATRGLYESALTFAYLLSHGGKHFLDLIQEECAADHFDTMKAWMAVCGGQQIDAQFEAQLAHYEKLRVQKRLNKTPSVSDMAKKVGAEAEREYSAMYSYFSKYTHPSLYHLVGDHREVFSLEACLLFGDKAVDYLKMIIADSQKIFDFALEFKSRRS